MNRIELFSTAQERLTQLLLRFPEASVITSILAQVNFLLDLEMGKAKDQRRLFEIVLGVQAAREIEPLDEETALVLYRVVDAVEAMKYDCSASTRSKG